MLMEGEMMTKARHEVERLMRKVSRERTRVLRELLEKVVALEVGQELYQNFLSSLPTTRELEEIVNGIDPDTGYTVHETINGYRFIRTR